jgi:uncharacterized membrane protein YkvA (DUF1232 family)
VCYHFWMKYSQLLNCLSHAGLSPEVAAPYMGVSNMTLRRWQKKKTQDVDVAYLPAIYDGLFGLIADSKLSMDAPDVREMIEEKVDGFHRRYTAAVMTSLGVETHFISGEGSENQIVSSLTQIGAAQSKRDAVEKESAQIAGHEKNGNDWKSSIRALTNVIKSKSLLTADKYVAYGALFYLIMPFDFIPDHLPIFGLLDDYAVLGMAFGFYKKRHPDAVLA